MRWVERRAVVRGRRARRGRRGVGMCMVGMGKVGGWVWMVLGVCYA